MLGFRVLCFQVIAKLSAMVRVMADVHGTVAYVLTAAMFKALRQRGALSTQDGQAIANDARMLQQVAAAAMSPAERQQVEELIDLFERAP